jgi:polyisoprenyl-teichoic acid--peptidoglycan teichoic acid transferase
MTDTLPRVDPGVRQERRRRKALRRRLIAGAGVVVPAVVLLAVVLTQIGDGGARPTPIPVGGEAEGDQITYLLVGTSEADITGGADWLTLLAVDRAGTNPLTLFIPAATLTEIPGFGFDGVAKAMALGRVPLQEVAIENLLGVTVDHTMLASEQLIARLVDAAGGIEVDVRSRLVAPVGTDRLETVFEAGKQRLDGARAVRYLGFRGENEVELARFVRAQQIWEGLYERSEANRGAELKQIVTALLNTSPVTDAPPADAGAFLGAFAAAGKDARAYRTLPVEAVGGGGPEDAFRVQQPLLDDLVRTLLAGSLPPDGPGRGARVQVLNGNGKPETGLAVADLLVPAGFRIADTGNAKSFDFKQTKIVVYREADLPAAQRIRQLLGVGAIELSHAQQTIVDVTVVVGRDFVARQS